MGLHIVVPHVDEATKQDICSFIVSRHYKKYFFVTFAEIVNVSWQ